MTFDLFVGIDYSGAETAESRLKSLQVYAAEPGKEPMAVQAGSTGAQLVAAGCR